MILSAYAKKLGITIAEAAERLLSDGGLSYLEDCYEALHTQSNEDVINELIDMANAGAGERITMTDKQRFLIYTKLGSLIARVREKNNVDICEAMKTLLEKKIIEKVEDLETGYYLEGSAYLTEVFRL